MQGEALPWLTSAAAYEATDKVAQVCSDTAATVTHPVMFVSRLDTTNPYHHTQVSAAQRGLHLNE